MMFSVGGKRKSGMLAEAPLAGAILEHIYAGAWLYRQVYRSPVDLFNQTFEKTNHDDIYHRIS